MRLVLVGVAMATLAATLPACRIVDAGAEEDLVYVIVEDAPELVGGLERLHTRLKYPEVARKAGVEGEVRVRFVVDEEGYPQDVVALSGIGAGCDEEAVRLIQEEARFTPGRQWGRPVKVRMSLVITFDLDALVYIVEHPPELIGGIEGLQAQVRYPEKARRAGVEGMVVVQFIVDRKGHVIDPVVLRGPGAGCGEEAVRVVSQARFKPGRQWGRPVKVKMALPIRFDLDAT